MEDSPKVEGLTGDALATAREMVFYHPICPFCGGSDWATADAGIVIHADTVDADGTPASAPVIAAGFICTGCHFIRFHALPPFGFEEKGV
jgi:hypothetical protein